MFFKGSGKRAMSARHRPFLLRSFLCFLATAGLNITMNGCTIKTAAADDARAIPLKKPATPTPKGTHIFSKWEEISTIKDNTGMDVMAE